MELQQAEVLAQLSSNDPRKQVAGLMLLRRDSVANPASLAPLAPFLVQRFVVPREAVAGDATSGRRGNAGGGRAAGAAAVQESGTTAAKTLADDVPHFVQKKLVYSMLRAVPLSGAPWVTLANCLDREVQGAWRAARAAGDSDEETNFTAMELGVTVLRTVAALPWSNLVDYLRPRWDTMIAIITQCPVVALRVAALGCLAAYVAAGSRAGCGEDGAAADENSIRGGRGGRAGRPVEGDGQAFREALSSDGAAPPAEGGHRMALVLRALHRSRFAEHLRGLLVDGSTEVCVEAWRLAWLMATGRSLRAVAPIAPLPAWFCSALGIDDDARRACLNRCLQLPGAYAQAVLPPLTALLASSRHAGTRHFLTLADRSLYPRLHSSWCVANLAGTTAALLSAATHTPALLLSTGPLASLCATRIVSALSTPLPTDAVLDSVRGNPAAAAAIVGAGVRLTLLRLLGGLLAVMGAGERVGHSDAIAAATVQHDYALAAARGASRYTTLVGTAGDGGSGGGRHGGGPSSHDVAAARVRGAMAALLARLCVSEVDDGRVRRPAVVAAVAAEASAGLEALGGGVSDDDDPAGASGPAPGAQAATSAAKPFVAAAVLPAVLRHARQALTAVGKSLIGAFPPADTAAGGLVGLILQGTVASLARAAHAAAAFVPGAEPGVAARDLGGAAMCAAEVERALRVAVAALDAVAMPLLATEHTCIAGWAVPGADSDPVAAVHPGLLRLLQAAAGLVASSLLPLGLAEYAAHDGSVTPADPSTVPAGLEPAVGVAAALLRLLEEAVTALECALPHLAAAVCAADPGAAEPAVAVPSPRRCRLVLPMLEVVSCVATVRAALGLAPTPLLRDAAQHHALTPLAATCCQTVIALDHADDAGASATHGAVIAEDLQAQYLVAAAATAAALLDGADRRVLAGRAEPGAAPADMPELQLAAQGLLADVRDVGTQVAQRCDAAAAPPHLARTTAAIRFCLAVLGVGPAPAGDPGAVSRRAAESLHSPHVSAPLWLPHSTVCLGGRPPRRVGQPIRTLVVSGSGDPLHVSVAYCVIDSRTVQAAVTVANRGPLCVSHVGIDVSALPPIGADLRIQYAGAGTGSEPLAFARSDAASPAAAAQLSACGAGQWVAPALAPKASVTASCVFTVSHVAATGRHPGSALADVTAGPMDSTAHDTGTNVATLGGIAVRVTAAVNVHGEVDTANDAARQRRNDADALLAYIRQRGNAKKNSAGAAATAVQSAASAVATQSRQTHSIAMHSLPPIAFSLLDALAPPPPMGPAACAAAARYLRQCPRAGAASTVLRADWCGLAADGRGDLDPQPWGFAADISEGVFATAEIGADAAGAFNAEDAALPASLVRSFLASAWLGSDAESAAGGAGGGGGIGVMTCTPAAPFVAIEIHRDPRGGPDGAVPDGREHVALVCVRSAPEAPSFARAVLAHADFPRLAASLLRWCVPLLP